ncbi:hypothetical protein [Salmonella sp. s51944]|uniref:hypothetical protein n=1 Tax=Salmonella sp. s51944 TaxID=3159655 RepID=UPI0039804F97
MIEILIYRSCVFKENLSKVSDVSTITIMNSKMIYILLALSVTIAVVAASIDEDELDNMLFENLVEKRGRKKKGKWGTCPDNANCACFMKGDTILGRGSCGQSGQVGL